MAEETTSLGSGSILDAVLSDDDQHIAVASKEGISLHQTETLSKDYSYKTNTTPIKLCISSNERYIAYASPEGKIFVIDRKIETNTVMERQEEIPISDFDDSRVGEFIYDFNHNIKINKINAMVFSPNEELLATAGHSTIILKGRILSRMTRNEAKDFRDSLPKFSIIVWDIAQNKTKYILSLDADHFDEVKGLVFSSDSKYLISWGSEQKGPFLWSMEGGKFIRNLNHDGDYDLINVMFTADKENIICEGGRKFTLSNFISGNRLDEYFFGPEDLPDWAEKAFRHRTEKKRKLESIKSKL